MNTKAHILILVENLPVPFDRRVWMESLALTEAGYKVSVISPQAPDDDQLDRVIDGIHIYRYPEAPAGKGKLNFVREFWYAYWQTRRIATRIWKDDPFDVIHSCNPPDIFWHLARRYRKHGVRFVFDQHDLCPELYLSKYNRRDPFYFALRAFEKLQYRTADGVISTNESYRRVAIERGGKSPEQVSVVRSGPLISRFHRVEPDPALRRGKKHLCVYLGVMGCQDGIDYALRAVRHAIDDGLQDTAFAFIGKGDEFDKLVALASELGLDDHAYFTGRISDEELKRYFSTAELGIAPDPKNPLNDVSTMNKIVEYMAMSLPIVSFDLAETRFSAGDAAVYIENDDERAMGQAIIELLADPPAGPKWVASAGSGLSETWRGIGVGMCWFGSTDDLLREKVVVRSFSLAGLGLWPNRADVRVGGAGRRASAALVDAPQFAAGALDEIEEADDPAAAHAG